MEGRRDSGREQERETETQRLTEKDWHLVGELLVHRGTGLLLEAGVSWADIVERHRHGEACSPPAHKMQRYVHPL